MFTQQDIWNFCAQLRCQQLGTLIAIQTLVCKLNQGNWVYNLQKNARNQIMHLFFLRNSLQRILKANSEVLIIDYKYKINCFKILLMVIIGQTALHITFYVTFVFITKKMTPHYTWII